MSQQGCCFRSTPPGTCRGCGEVEHLTSTAVGDVDVIVVVVRGDRGGEEVVEPCFELLFRQLVFESRGRGGGCEGKRGEREDEGRD